MTNVKSFEEVKVLNFGGMCQLLYFCNIKTIWVPGIGINNASRPNIVKILYSAVLSDKEIGDGNAGILSVSNSQASLLFNSQKNIDEDIIDRARIIDFNIMKNNVQRHISSYLNPCNKTYLTEKLKSLVDKISIQNDRLQLKDYLDFIYEDTPKSNALFCDFLTKCIHWCFLVPNTPYLNLNMEDVVFKCIPDNYITYDPHNLSETYAKSTAILIVLFDNENKTIRHFHNPERCLDYVFEKNLIIKSIDSKVGRINMHCLPQYNGCILRRIEDDEFELAKELVKEYLWAFKVKESWRERALSDMVYNGLLQGIWVGYGYFDSKGTLISYLDYKLRSDGNIELGVALTRGHYTNMNFISGLINLIRLKFIGNDIFSGTYEENGAMIHTFEKNGFKPNYFYDKVSKKKSNKIQDRVNPDFPNDKEKRTNSVYYHIPSLIAESLKYSEICDNKNVYEVIQ